MKHIAILAYDMVATFEFASALELFALERPEFEDWYTAEAVCIGRSQVRATGGINIKLKAVDSLDAYNMLVIPGWGVGTTRNADLNKIFPEPLLNTLREFHESGGRIISFCSGAFLLAEAGLLDGKEATTHWQFSELFKRRYPKVKFKENVLYVYDGSLGCSAGSAAGLDLGMEVIRRDWGYDMANTVARRLVISPHRSGGQAQFVETPLIGNQSHFAETLNWANARLHQDIDIETMANTANMSRRSFDRHFRAATGMSPKEWLIRQRLALAQQLLVELKLPMEVVAEKSGFKSAMNLRHHFKNIFGISPSQYQMQFGNAV